MLRTQRLITATRPAVSFSWCSPSRLRKLLVRLWTTFSIWMLLCAIVFASMRDRRECQSALRAVKRNGAVRGNAPNQPVMRSHR